ncbi:MAG: hypothetical protein R6X25_04075, partial [Candidatus Krumholzibacteriia bacterium]
GRTRTYINLALTMLLGGLWHGAAWTFVVWGGLHGLYLAVHKAFLGERRIAERYRWTGPASLVGYVAGVIGTNLLVLFAWLFFRAESFEQAWYFLDRFVHWQGSGLGDRFLVITAAMAAMVLLLDILEYASRSHVYLLRLRPPVTAGVCTAVMLVVGLYLAVNKPLPFIYFQF